MALTWKQFTAGVTDQRFIQPLWKFEARIEYVPTVLDNAMLAAASQFISNAVVNAIRNVKGCPLSALTMKLGDPRKEEEDDDKQRSYFTLVNGVPVYDFALLLGPRTLLIRKDRTSLQDVVATLPIFESICSSLFPNPTPPGQSTNAPRSLADILTVGDRIHLVAFTFDHRLRVTNHITQPNKEATNVEMITKVARTSGPAGTNPQEAPLAVLQPFRPYRGDVTLSTEKTIARKKRNVWVQLEAPYNILQKDIDLSFSYRAGEGMTTDLTEEDLRDWTTPLTLFYRDIILNQFLPALFYDVNIEPRIA